MSFLVKQPANPAAALTDPEPRSSYSEAQTIPFPLGQHPIASHWLCDAYHRRTAPAGQQQPDHNYASIAAGFCLGPILYVGAVWRDGKIINNLDYAFGENEDEHTFTIQAGMKGGYNFQLVLRRGTETQTASSALRTATGQQHPPYKGLVWGEWINIPLGQGTTAIPDLQLELRAEVPELGAFGGGVHPYCGVNPLAAIHTYATRLAGGLGAPASIFPAAHWGDQAAFLEQHGVGGRTGSLTGIHPIVSAQRSAGAVFADILSYCDGYLYADGGQLKVGWFPNQAVDASTLPVISEADLTDKPTGVGFADWNSAPASATVVFTEQGRYYNKTPASSPAPANSETGLVSTPVRKDRPWIHTMEQAAIMAAEAATDDGNDDSGVSLPVLTSRLDAAGLVPGALFRWAYAPHSLSLLCRVIARRGRSGRTSETIQVIRERNAFPAPFVGTADERVAPTVDEPGTVTASDVRLWLVPTGLRAVAEQREVAVLINRGKLEITSATIALSPDGAEPWATVLTQSFFAAKCAVAIAINESAGTVRVTSMSVDFTGMAACNAVEQTDDTLLAIVGNELCSVGAITAVAANTVDLGILRGRRGSTAAAHANGDLLWLVRRSELLTVNHRTLDIIADSAGYSATVATKYFRIALATHGQPGDFAPAAPGLSITLPDPTPGAISDLTAITIPGRIVKLRWSKVEGADEYRVYRDTVLLPAEVGGTTFTDIGVEPGSHSYRVQPESLGELIGPLSNTATVTVSDIDPGGIDYSPPANPSAPTITGATSKVADDGTVSVEISVTLPGLPTGAVGINLYYAVAGGPAILGDQIDEDRRAASAVFGIDELPPNKAVRVWIMGFSAYGIFTAEVDATNSPYTTPLPPRPAAPTNITMIAGDSNLVPRPPSRIFGNTGLEAYALTLKFTLSASRDVIKYFFVGTAIDDLGAASLIFGTNGADAETSGDSCHYYALTNDTRFIWACALSSTYQYSDLVRVPQGNAAPYLKKPLGGATIVAAEFDASSSRRYKRRIRPIKNALALVEKSRPVWYDERRPGGKRKVAGLIAEEFVDIVPAHVRRDEQLRPDSINYGPLVAVAFAAMREMRAQHKGEVRELWAVIRQMQRDLRRLRHGR